ncbi:MAG: DUF885 domain-containing protein [Bryobacteraceae bacterium]
MKSTALALVLVLVAALALGGCKKPAPPTVAHLVDDFVYGVLGFSPIMATAAGYHTHMDQHLDEMLDSYDEVDLKKQRDFYNGLRERMALIQPETLSVEDRADFDILADQIRAQLLELDTIQNYKHNPTVYVEQLGSALFNPFVLEYAPLEERYRHIAARLTKVPQLLGQAQRNLVDAPEVWVRVAIAENDGNRDLITKVILPKSPESMKLQMDRQAQEALQAIDRFNTFLSKELSKHPSDWRLGKEKYALKFGPALELGLRPEEVLADAEAELERARGEMVSTAKALNPKATGDADSIVRKALDEIAGRHAKREQYFGQAEKDLEEVRQFVRAKGFVKLPTRDNLKVIPTPVFMRGIYAVGGFNPAPALEPKLGAFYWLTPIEETMAADQVESKLREYNAYGLKLLTIHEAIPGHYLQFEYANDVEPQSRRILRGLFGNGPYVEGWAVYSTEVTVEQGYLDNDPRMKLTWLKQYLRTIANTILDVRMQTMGMTDEQAMSLMVDKTFQEKQEATAKLQRAKLSSTQLPTYFTGFRAWKRLRAEAQSREGAAFDLARFHQRALAAGAVPMPALGRILARK